MAAVARAHYPSPMPRSMPAATAQRAAPPLPCAAWRIHERQEGTEVAHLLEDTARGRFFRLTDQGRFIWERLDGALTASDLRRAYRDRYGVDDQGMIASLLASLDRQGFLAAPVASALPGQPGGPARSPGLGFAGTAYRLLTASVTLEGVDAPLATLYRRGGRLLFTPLARIAWFLLAALGGAMFLSLWAGQRIPVAAASAGWLVPTLLVLGWAVHVPLHELQHALTATHLGRRVRRAGIGWFWFVPVCWTDTSEMWLEGRRRRFAVDAAGPYSNLVMGGALALLLPLLPAGGLQSGLFDVALMLYAGFLSGMNPLLENDGYYLLEDLLGTEGLRPGALRFFAGGPAAWRGHRLARAEWGYLLYALSGLAYLTFACWQLATVYQAQVQQLLTPLIAPSAAQALGWVLPGLFAGLVIAGLAHEVATARRAPASSGGAPLEQRINK